MVYGACGGVPMVSGRGGGVDAAVGGGNTNMAYLRNIRTSNTNAEMR